MTVCAGREGTRATGLGHPDGISRRRPLRAAGPRTSLPRWPRLEVSGDSRGTGRFQPRPIFGESLSRLRHPAPRGRRSWERARRRSCLHSVPEKCIPASHARVPPRRKTPGLAGQAWCAQGLNPRQKRENAESSSASGRGWRHRALQGLCHFSRPPSC